MVVFIVGGSKSKKSFYGEYFAEDLQGENGVLYYLATMKPYDNEDLKRIENHIKSRSGGGYITIEKEKDIIDTINTFTADDTILLDSVTSLLTNEMFGDGKIITEVYEKIYLEILEISKAIKNLVIVSDYVLNDSIVYDKYTENFKREIGKLNCKLAEISDVVIESSFGNLTFYKGGDKLSYEKDY